MSKNGKNVQEMFKNMRQLYIEVGEFMKAFERLASDFKYYPFGSSSTVLRDNSQSLHRPEQWLPDWMYRIYRNKFNKKNWLILNIGLYYVDRPERMKEPLAIIEEIETPSRKKEMEYWDPRDLYFHTEPYTKKIGKIYTLDDLKIDVEELRDEMRREDEFIKWFKTTQFCIMAVPLLEMKNMKAIKTRIFDKLVSK